MTNKTKDVCDACTNEFFIKDLKKYYYKGEHYPECPKKEKPEQTNYQVTISMVRVYEVTAKDEIEAESKASYSAFPDWRDV